MCHVNPPLWALLTLREKIKNHSQKGSPSDLTIFFFLPSAVVPGVWPVFGRILSTRDLRRNLRIQ